MHRELLQINKENTGNLVKKKKMDKRLEQVHQKKEIWMANKYNKRGSTSLEIKKIKNKSIIPQLHTNRQKLKVW